MSKYTELVKALRKVADYINCYECDMWGLGECDTERKSCVLHNAAAAIEELQAEVKRLEPKRGERTINPYESTWAIENGYI